VTIGGECFEAELRSVSEYQERDGVVHKFYLTDKASKRGKRLVSVFISGTLVASCANYTSRADIVRLNAIRRAFDQGAVNLDALFDERHYTELALSPQDFQIQQTRTDGEIRRYIIHKAYWLAYRFPIHAQAGDILYPIPFDEPADLDYLGATAAEIWRNIRRMEGQGLLGKVLEGHARPSELLLSGYESGELLGRASPAATSVSTGAADDRKFAKLAVEEARKSAPEDSRIHPKVGVVVVKDGRILATAHRGEIPQCHAEFIALEKKLTDVALLGATVYTTLEPCTSRNHPKVPCAIRLTERKVSRVVIGMLDPDDRISGRGQRALRKAGIATELFPHDLMGEVEELNRDFVRDREFRENDRRNEKQESPPDFYNFGGNPGHISFSGITHSVQGPWMDVWGLVTIVNPTQSPVKIALHRLFLDGKECAVHSMFFRPKSNPVDRFERISLMGNAKEDYEVHVMFPDTDYPTPPSRDGELWVSSDNRPGEFPVKVRCP
jgi:pyrimidine deaminase RibD-like protein